MNSKGKSNRDFLAKSLVEPLEGDYCNIWLSIDSLNVLSQPRKTFSEISELASAIAEKKLLKPPIVARWTGPQCQAYLDFINEVWGENFALSGLKSTVEDEQTIYYVLIAGERRYRACRLLWDSGCSQCQEIFGPNKEPGECFRRHFRRDTLDVRIADGITASYAAEVQQMENNHKPVPIAEEAHSFVLMYKTMRKSNPDLSVSAFARTIGRSAETVRKAMRFIEYLPESVQRLVEQGKIAYGIGIELTRLHKYGVAAATIEEFAVDAQVSSYRLPQFRQMISDYIGTIEAGQGSLFDGLPEADQKAMLNRRQTVAAKSVRAVHTSLAYLQVVEDLVKEGLIGQDEAPFSSRSPRRVARELANYLRRANGGLSSVVGEKRTGQLKKRGKKLAALIAALEEDEGDANNTGD